MESYSYSFEGIEDQEPYGTTRIEKTFDFLPDSTKVLNIDLFSMISDRYIEPITDNLKNHMVKMKMGREIFIRDVKITLNLKINEQSFEYNITLNLRSNNLAGNNPFISITTK